MPDSSQEPDTGSLDSGTDIGRYRHATYHRSGIASTVFKAVLPFNQDKDAPTKQKKLQWVALKVTELAAMQPPHDYHREIRALHRAASPHVIKLLEDFPQQWTAASARDFEIPGSRHVLVFPFMPFDLPSLLCHRAKFTVAQRKSCLRDLFSALAHLHSLGIIHRDVKPSNILLESPDGPAFLADFGIVWDPQDPASEPPDDKITDVGTTSYRPLELLFGNTSYGAALDLWAAGCVAAEVVDSSIDTLFDAGDLGSELALIQSIFKKLGTPTLESWPVRSAGCL